MNEAGRINPTANFEENKTKGENIEEVLQSYISVIETYMTMDKSVANEMMLQLSYFLFEQHCYEYSVIIWSRLLDIGFKKDEIAAVIEEAFVLPNLEETRQNYKNNTEKYRDHIYADVPCDFEQLPYRLIPVETNVYYLWDWNQCKISGKTIWLKDDDGIETLDTYDTTLYLDHWDFFAPVSVKRKNPDKLICFLSQHKSVFCYFMFPEFENIFGDSWYIFSSQNEIESFFHTNRSKSLPMEIVGTENGVKELEEWRQREHSFRCSPKGRCGDSVMLTIGIPSYNRGHRALENIRHLQKLPYDFEVEFLVVNNCSIENTEGYDEIEKLQEQDSRISYYRFPDTPGGHWSGYEAINRAKGKFCCLLSDEDSILLESVSKYLRLIQKYGSTLGFINSAGKIYYSDLDKSAILEKGGPAFYFLFWRLNYISGLIFNTSVWHEKDLYSHLVSLGQKNYFVAAYGYNVGVLYICLEKNVCLCKEQLFTEGKAEKSSAGSEIKDGKRILTYASLGKRLEQLEGALQVLNDCSSCLPVGLIKHVYVNICYKVFFLLDLYRRIYGEIEYSYQEAYECILRASINNIQNINTELQTGEYAWIVEQIWQSYSEYYSLLDTLS